MKRKHSLSCNPYTTYFATATITEFTNLFDREPLAQIFLDNLRFYADTFEVSIHGFVIMPNHIHLLLTTGKHGTISQFMQRLKERTAKQIIKWCEEQGEKALLEIFILSAGKYKRRSQHQIWQERFDALVINQPETFTIKLDYIHNNPLQEKWRLCDRAEDYKFSSARYYLKNLDAGIPVEIVV